MNVGYDVEHHLPLPPLTHTHTPNKRFRSLLLSQMLYILDLCYQVAYHSAPLPVPVSVRPLSIAGVKVNRAGLPEITFYRVQD